MLFFSFLFRFWFGVGFSARHFARAEKFFVRLGQRTPSVWRSRPQHFEVHFVPMAKGDAKVRSLCATNAQPPPRDPLVKRSRPHGKRAARLRYLPPTRAAFRCALLPGGLPRPATTPGRRE